MESFKNKKNTSTPKIIILQCCKSYDSEEDKKKKNVKLNEASSFDSINYQDSELEVSNFSNDKLNGNKNNSNKKEGKLSSIPENENEEKNSSMRGKKENDSKILLMEIKKVPQQNGSRIINYISSNGVTSSLFGNENKNGQQEISSIDKKNEPNEKINKIKERNVLEVDDDKNVVINKQCICTTCNIF